MPAPPPTYRRRWLLLPAGAMLGAAAAFLAPSTGGCIYHDTCIMVTSAGTDFCRNVALAKQWPVGGSLDDAEPILRPDGSPPRGCRCYNDAELQIFEDGAPACKLALFDEELALAAREACQSLVPPGFDHNCWTSSGPQASIVEARFEEGPGACVGNCEFGAPPVNGSCPELSPYECATGGDADEGCDSEGDTGTGASDSGLDDTSSDTSGDSMLDVEMFVTCDGRACEIDEAFAQRLHAGPSSLVHEGTFVVYDGKLRRHVLHGVEPGSVLHALGLRNRDQLESINAIIIHDLDSALRAYAELADAAILEVRIKRGSLWLDFTYTFVP